jgi:hypothetical protein
MGIFVFRSFPPIDCQFFETLSSNGNANQWSAINSSYTKRAHSKQAIKHQRQLKTIELRKFAWHTTDFRFTITCLFEQKRATIRE